MASCLPCSWTKMPWSISLRRSATKSGGRRIQNGEGTEVRTMAMGRRQNVQMKMWTYAHFNWRCIFGLLPYLLLDEEALEYIPEEVYNKKPRKKNPKRRIERNKNKVRGKKTKYVLNINGSQFSGGKKSVKI